MAISDWYEINNLPVERQQRAQGKWRVEYNELMTRIRVSTNHKTHSDWVNSGLDFDVYREIAEQMVLELNRRPH
jgi:hypothetical protein